MRKSLLAFKASSHGAIVIATKLFLVIDIHATHSTKLLSLSYYVNTPIKTIITYSLCQSQLLSHIVYGPLAQIKECL